MEYSEEDLMGLAKSYRTTEKIKAVNDKNTTTKVILEVINNTQQVDVISEVFKSPLLNQEIVDAIYENNKKTKEIIKLIINSSYYSLELFNKMIDETTNESILSLLINCKYATAESYKKILKNIKNYQNTLKSVAKCMCDGPCISSEIIDEFITIFGYYIDSELINKILNTGLVSNNQLKKIINILKNRNRYDIVNLVNNLFSCNSITNDDLIFIINNFEFDLESLLKCPICTPETIKDVDISTKKEFNAILNWDKLTPDLLENIIVDKKISYKLTDEDVNELLNNSIVNENILISIVKTINTNRFSFYSSYSPSSYVKQIISDIINHPKMSQKVAIEIMRTFNKNNEIQNLVLESKFANKDIKIEYYLDDKKLYDRNTVDSFFEIDGLKVENVIRALEISKSQILIEKAMEFDKSSTELNSKLVQVIFDSNKNLPYSREAEARRFYNDAGKDLISRNLTEDDLIFILDQQKYYSDFFELVMKHPNAGMKVVDKAFSISEIVTDKKERDLIIQAAEKLKKDIISKIYTIEEEKDVTEILRMNVEDGLSTMLWGPSGVGKTSRVLEVDPTATMLILKNGMLPEEVIGGREPNGEPGKLYPPHWYNVLCEKCNAEKDRKHILFIDEFTNVNDTIKNLVWEIIGCGLVNGHEEWPLPENCSLVVAGNRPEESTAVRIDANGGVMPAPLHNRIASMLEIEFNIDEWQKWALETDYKTGKLRMHPIVYSFCVANSNVMFTNYNPEKVTEPFLSPRTWEALSKTIYKAEERGPFNHVSNKRIYSILGNNEIANAFISHYERLPIDMQKIKMGTYKESDFPKIDDKLFALGMIISNYDGDDITIENFIYECLGDEYMSIYQTMKLIRNATLDSVNNNLNTFRRS